MAFLTLAEVYKTHVAGSAVQTGASLPLNGILGVMPFKPASHGNQDKFRLYGADSGATIINGGSGITPSTNSATLTTIDLAIVKAVLSGESTYVESWNSIDGLSPVLSYFESNSAGKYSAIRNKIANAFFYGAKATEGFNGFLVSATADSTVKDMGADVKKGTDIFVVRFDDANNYGLYNKDTMTQNGLVEFNLLPKQMVTDSSGDLVETYNGVYKSVLGTRAVSGYISVIEGIDATHKPAIVDINNALDQAGAYKEGQTFIFCSAKGRQILSDVLGDELKSTNMNAGEAVTYVSMYNGHRIVIDDSISNLR